MSERLIIKLLGYERKTLDKNGALILKVPYITREGRISDRDVPTKVFPDNVDKYGNIIVTRKGGRVKPLRR